MNAGMPEQDQVARMTPGVPDVPGAYNKLPPVLQMSVGREVRKWRRYRDLNGADLSKAAGISFGMLSRIESGTVTPSLATLQSLASALGVPISAFFRRSSKALIPQEKFGETEYVNVLTHAAGKRNVIINAYILKLDDGRTTREIFNKGYKSFMFVIRGELSCGYRNEAHDLRAGDSILTDNKEAIFVTGSRASQGLVLCVDVGLEAAGREFHKDAADA